MSKKIVKNHTKQNTTTVFDRFYEIVKWIFFLLTLAAIYLPYFRIENKLYVYILLGCAAIFYAINYFFIAKKLRLNLYYYLEYVINTLFVMALLASTGNLKSPYYLFLYALIAGAPIRLSAIRSITAFLLVQLGMIFISWREPFDAYVFIQTEATIILLFSISFFFTRQMHVLIRKELEQQIYIKRLQQINTMKDEFTFFIAHQLKSPLTALRGYGDILKQSMIDFSHKNKELVLLIHETICEFEKMIEDLLNKPSFFLTHLTITPTYFHVAPLIDTVIKSFTFAIQEKNIQITSLISPSVTVYADPAKTKEVVRNLVDNAIKYSPEKTTIVINAKKWGKNIILEIKDKGYGVEKEYQSLIFKRFHRGAYTNQSTAQGVGLGLFIVKRLVTAMGGKIWFTSKLHKGSTFFFTLPTKKSPLK